MVTVVLRLSPVARDPPHISRALNASVDVFRIISPEHPLAPFFRSRLLTPYTPVPLVHPIDYVIVIVLPINSEFINNNGIAGDDNNSQAMLQTEILWEP